MLSAHFANLRHITRFSGVAPDRLGNFVPRDHRESYDDKLTGTSS
jgi:hypothetical protein